MELLHTAKRLHEDGFAVIPTGARKEGLAKEWQKMTGDNRVEPNGNFNSERVHGVGIVTGTEVAMHYLLAIDVDCYDKAVSSKVCDYIDKICKTEGKLSFRIGESPKFLVPVLCDENSRKINSKKFKDSKIEVLGQGQQFVAYGAHPKSKTGYYRWYNREFDVNNLPVITLDDIRHIIAYFEDTMRAAGYTTEDTSAPSSTADDPFAGLQKSDVSLDEAKEILSYIDPDCDYDTWFRVGAALHHEFEGASEAYDLWDDWSSTGSKYDENKGANDPDTKWASFETEGDTVSFRTLCQFARKGGADLSAISRKHKVKDQPTSYDTDAYQEQVEKADIPDSLFLQITDTYQKADHTVYWTIEKYIEKAVVVNYYGESGVGKSFGAIDMSLSIATGMDWLGCRTKKGQVLYVAGEGHNGINRRVYAWRSENGFPDTSNLHVTQRALNLTHESDRILLEAYLDTLDNPQLIVIDTWGRATAGINENSSEDVQPIIEYLAHLTRKYNCTVMVLHHTPKAHTNDSAGSKNIKSSMDVEIAMVRREGIDGVVMESRKMKESKKFEPVVFKFVPIQLPVNYNDEYGSPTYSAVLKAEEDSDAVLKSTRGKLTDNGRIAVDAYEYLEDNHPEMFIKTPDEMKVEHGGFNVTDHGFDEVVLRSEISKRLVGVLGEDRKKQVPQVCTRALKDAIKKGYLCAYEADEEIDSTIISKRLDG